MLIFFLIVVVLLSLLLVYRITTKVSDKVKTNKIVKFSLKNKSQPQPKINKQICSYCRKKEKKLAFYSDEQGRVVGVCSSCKIQAERRALMRL